MTRRLSPALLVAVLVAAAPTVAAPPAADSRDARLTPEQLAEREARRARTALDFDNNGVVAGQPVPDLETRRKLASEFKDLLRVEVPIVLDPMTNQGWQALGGAPTWAS